MTTLNVSTAPLTADPDFATQVGTDLTTPADYLRTMADNLRPSSLPCNVGISEQMIRMGTGAGFLIAAAFAPLNKQWRIGMASLGAMELITGALGYCPVWHVMGINTSDTDED